MVTKARIAKSNPSFLVHISGISLNQIGKFCQRLQWSRWNTRHVTALLWYLNSGPIWYAFFVGTKVDRNAFQVKCMCCNYGLKADFRNANKPTCRDQTFMCSLIVPSQKSWRDVVLYTNLCFFYLWTFKQNNTVQLLHPPAFFVSFLGEPRGSPGGHLVRLGIRWLRPWLFLIKS